MNSIVKFYRVLLFSLFIFFNLSGSYASAIRGATTDSSISAADVADFRKMGGRYLRISFANNPFYSTKPPYFKNENAFSELRKLIFIAKENQIKIILDPHFFPGMRIPYTTVPNDELWVSLEARQAILKMWVEVAKFSKDYPDVIDSYDILNEPSIDLRPGKAKNSVTWNDFAPDIVRAIRSVDKSTKLIVQPVTGFDERGHWIDRLRGMTYLKPIDDKNVIYSPHFYLPKEYTHQGVFKEFPVGEDYPGIYEGIYWDKNQLRKRLSPALDFQKKYNSAIYIGEFSVSCYAGESATKYISDLIEIFEEYGWSWTYHAYRESPVWSMEVSDDRCVGPLAKLKSRPSSDSSRLNVIKQYFK